VLQAFVKEASNTESTHAAPFFFKGLTTFFFYRFDEAGFSDFADESA
jgi:hypothetical protein